MLRNKVLKKILISILLIINTWVYSQTLPKFTITTEHWKPFQYIENGEKKGISVDIMDSMLQYLDSEQTSKDINFFPWARAYHKAIRDDNTILFLTTKTEERENLFKWVGPLLSYNTYLIARKDHNITIKDPVDLQNYRIGSVEDDASEIFLNELGVPLEDLVRAKKGTDVVTILTKGRIQILLSEWTSFVSDVKSLNLNLDDFEPIYLSSTSKLYYAFSVTTSDEIIDRFQNAFDQIKESGKIEEIFNQYGEDLVEVDFVE